MINIKPVRDAGCCMFAMSAIMVLINATATVAQAGDVKSAAPAIYHADPAHLWNRLHAALLVRVGPDGIAYGQDRLEPLMWAESKHLLEHDSHERAMAVLQEFTKTHGEKLIDAPLKRAVLQRDLWLIFNTLEDHHRDFAEPKLTPEEASRARERLQIALADVIRRVALSPEAIRSLPDNYEAAVASGLFAKSGDPQKPIQPFLPADLFAPDGPWVCVGRTDGRTAPQHLRDENPFSNSVFLVLIRLPAGRAGGIDYLKRRPAFPQGTELALVRQAMLIDTSARIVPSKLTESVQLRVIQSPELTVEFRLSRAQLFADKAGGMRASSEEERDFKTGFSAKMWDEFEHRYAFDPVRGFPDSGLHLMKLCSTCHTSRFHEFRSGNGVTIYPIAETPASQVAGAAIRWKEQHLRWMALRKLLAESPK